MTRRVVRVEINGRRYAYRCRGARRGDVVRVDTPHSGVLVLPVVGFGRRLWWGRLKSATLWARRA